jgi:hypothetical protein
MMCADLGHLLNFCPRRFRGRSRKVKHPVSGRSLNAQAMEANLVFQVELRNGGRLITRDNHHFQWLVV